MQQAEFFAIRGVIEGFYGTPWTHAERLDMLAFMGRHRFNAYFYSPKDDLYLRERWQEPHPADELRKLDELLQQSRDANLSFFYCVSPGLSMEYSNPQHFAALMDKYAQMFDRGVRHFSLLFDDIPPTLLHDRDKQQYEHLAAAHVDTANRVAAELSRWSGENKLVVCPTTYHGLGNEPYILHLGNRLNAEIGLFWTGRFVCSPSLTDGDAARFAEWTKHLPLYWDNYPVNDLAMSAELHIGPLLHRDPQLYKHSLGYVANAMEYAESSKIPLITIAEFLHDPEQYDAEAAWRRAIAEVAGETDAPAFLRFADNVRSSFLNDRESPALMEAFHEFRFHFFHGNQKLATNGLIQLFQEMEQTANDLLMNMQNKRLAREVRPWLVKYWHWAKVGQAAAALIAEGHQGRFVRAMYHLLSLKRWLKRTERLPHKVSGNVMRIFVEAVLQEVTRRGTPKSL